MDSNIFISALAKRSDLLFFSYDLELKSINYANTSFLEFFNATEEMINHVAVYDLLHNDDKELINEKIKECISKERVIDLECRFVRGTQIRFLRIDAYLQEIDGNRLILGHARDITHYKEYTENLNNHNSKKNSILNILAHDLSGPIGTVGNLSELLKKETASLNNVKIIKYLDMIEEISKRSLNLIRNFINQEFLESQAVNLLKKRVDLILKISNATQMYFNLHQHFNLTFSHTAINKPIYVNIDEDKFLQVVNNLISNAMKFTPIGGDISILVAEEEESVLITVADSGIGIPEQFHKTLFDKFTDARRTGLNGEPSTGLGMSIIKTIVEWHQGKIWFESSVNKGTTFYIRLPK
jgi:two-component system sensor histidine kinase VicK